MARKHTFFIVVLLAAAAVSGLFAFVRTVDLGQPTAASAPAPAAVSESALEARLRALDRFEAKLRKQLAKKPSARQALPATVITRVAAPQTASGSDEFEHEEEEGDDD